MIDRIKTKRGNMRCKYCKYKKRNELFCNRTRTRIRPDVIGCSEGINR